VLCRIVGTNLIIPHIVGNAGVLRNFSAYLAQLLNVDSRTDLQIHTSGGLDLDFLAFGLSLALTLLLILGTQETSLFNLGMATPHEYSSTSKQEFTRQSFWLAHLSEVAVSRAAFGCPTVTGCGNGLQL
jgi:hypothetical protein